MLYVFHTLRRLLPYSSLSMRRLLTMLTALADLHAHCIVRVGAVLPIARCPGRQDVRTAQGSDAVPGRPETSLHPLGNDRGIY